MSNPRNNNNNNKETFGFKTSKPAPSVAELKDFENDMYEIVKNVKFRKNKQTTCKTH